MKIGKGSKQRPPQISREEEAVRWKLAFGQITFDEFERRYNQLLKEGKIYRRPRYQLEKGTGK